MVVEGKSVQCVKHLVFVADQCLPENTFFTLDILNITGVYFWQKTEIGSVNYEPCPCNEFFNAQAVRQCGGSFTEGAMWNEPDYSQCEAALSQITRSRITINLCLATLVCINHN